MPRDDKYVLRARLLKKGYTEDQLVVPKNLTAKTFFRCDSDLQGYWCLTYGPEIDAILDQQKQIAEDKRNAETSDNKSMWRGGATSPEDLETFAKIMSAWAALCPQFDANSNANGVAVADYLKSRSLPITSANLTAAYEYLVQRGELILLPDKIGLPEESLQGYGLKHSLNLSTLMEKHAPLSEGEIDKRRVSKLSADDYKREHIAEFGEQQLDSRIERDLVTAVESLKAMKPVITRRCL